VVSPASAAKVELVARGCERLRSFGYEPIVMPHALDRGPLYYAGTAPDRVADLHAAFADASIDGVICTRGGWGSAELLPLLDRELIRANPKVFVGYSDHTSLHAWFWNECELPTYYAPMVAADWAKDDGVDERSWNALVEGQSKTLRFDAADGMKILRPGAANGRVLGGCLSIVVEALGTPWALKMEEPTVLFLEDIGTKPYKWDRFLQHLKFAGGMKHVRGVVFGDTSANIDKSETELLEAACLHALGDFDGPVAIGLQSGHVDARNRTVALGTRVELNCDGAPSLEFVGD
jgi:muramoyltetrapeptide carboxypeptidase